MNWLAEPRVKVCCIASIEEAWMAVRAGASAVGLVSQMPSGPGVIGEELIGKIAAEMPPGVATFLLTCKQDAEAIIVQQRRCGVNTVQICDRLASSSYSMLRAGMPGVAIVQVVHVVGEESVEESRAVSGEVNAILLDSGNPKLKVKELGGTGRRHDWEISRRICEAVKVPVFLAGGLNAENVGEAIEKVRPYGIDVCSGVRNDGRLDEEKLKAMLGAVRAAAARVIGRE